MIQYKRASTDLELQQILQLQQQNLPKNLSAEEMKIEGFLTVEHNFDLLKRMNDACPHTIAIANERVVGYALSMHPKFGKEIDILKSMFNKIDEAYSSDSFLVMGQICISKDHRGQGVFRELYENMKRFIQPQFQAIITEVDVKNSRSMQAHQAIGFQELSRYQADGVAWSLIVLE